MTTTEEQRARNMGELKIKVTLPDGNAWEWVVPHLTVTHDLAPNAPLPRLIGVSGHRQAPPRNAVNVPLPGGHEVEFIAALEAAYQGQEVEVAAPPVDPGPAERQA